jgi:Zinc binding domain
MSDRCSSDLSAVSQSTDDSAESRCPNCGETGQPVSPVTLKHMVRPDFLELVSKTGFRFCRAVDCSTVYFHADGEVLKKTDLRVRVGLKETLDPVLVCYCFGFTERMLLEEIQASGHTTIPERIKAEIKAEHCACELRNPQGSCCLGNVRAAEKRARQIATHAKPV